MDSDSFKKVYRLIGLQKVSQVGYSILQTQEASVTIYKIYTILQTQDASVTIYNI